MNLIAQLQHTDIYLIDQILKNRFKHTNTILDVGCGSGRNFTYFLQNGFNVFGIDTDENSIQKLIKNNQLNPNQFKVAAAENIPFDQLKFDLIICNAVLHFAKNKLHFEEMLFSMWNRLGNNGMLFIRLASDIGIEKLVAPIGNGIFQLPDGSKRYLVSDQILITYTQQLKAQLVEPIKTTNVQSLRCMTTWILKKESINSTN